MNVNMDMKIDKKRMSPMRIELLKTISKRGETNENGLTVGNSYNKNSIKLAIKRLSELGLITFTGGGYFEISQKGTDYLGVGIIQTSSIVSNKE